MSYGKSYNEKEKIAYDPIIGYIGIDTIGI